MYKIKYFNNHIGIEDCIKFCSLNEAVKKYIELRDIPWWEFDIKNLRLYSEDGQDITQVLNNYLDGVEI